MIFPFESLSGHAREIGLVVAVVIGIAFGFVLERAGFGRATKLAAQFYLRDLTVFKVMFGAIVTAMLGLVVASSIGLTSLRDISESIVSWTYVWPMLAGGFLLGVGFIVSGYCPGTSIVAMASGSIDGLFAVVGVVTGTFVYSELLQIPRFHQFHGSGEKGAWFLYDLVPVPPPLLAAIIAVVALAAFVGAEKLERIFGGALAVAERRPVRQRRFAFATIGIASVVAVALIAVPMSAPAAAPQAATITAAELAKRLVAEPWRVRVVDLRENAKDRIAGSEIVKPDAVAEIPDDGRTVVIVGTAARVPPHARLLAGGFDAWSRDPLARAMSSGAPPPPPPTPAAGGGFAKPKKKGGGCSA